MIGLEKLLKYIEEEATIKARGIILGAIGNAKVIIDSSEVEAKKTYEQITKQSETDTKVYLERAKSAANLQQKKLVLQAKQQIIADVIEAAKASIMELKDDAYFDLIIKMAVKYALPQSGYILFSSLDHERMPKKFEKTLEKALSEIEGAKLAIGKETRNIEGGFILLYGDIEENCSFEALFMANREYLQDQVCQLLFE